MIVALIAIVIIIISVLVLAAILSELIHRDKEGLAVLVAVIFLILVFVADYNINIF